MKPNLKSIDEVIEGIDSLLGDIDENSNNQQYPSPVFPRVSEGETNEGSFRVQNELMPDILLDDDFQNQPSGIRENESVNLDDINPSPNFDSTGPKAITQPVQQMPEVDFRSATMEELLREVELLDLPEFVAPLSAPVPSIAEPLESAMSSPGKPELNLPSPTVIETPLLSSPKEDLTPVEIPNYTVLGERIDVELKARIREAIMETRRASGGSDNPYVTRSVFKATSYCNRVLGRLNATHHKRYRRDVLLSLIGMHERNQAWVDAAKSYERYLEEFASDDTYPFEES
ncbi:MAG: hypothetical protein ACJZ72_06655 [Opitutales bacterium]